MNSNKRFGTYTDIDGKTAWIVFGNRYQAKKAQNGEKLFNQPGTSKPIDFGEMLTERQMQRRGLLR